MKRFLFILVLLLSLVASSTATAKPAWAKGESRGEDLRIYLVTFGVGDDIASWFGHTALMVSDKRTRQQRIYNYGMFSFGPDMLPKFLMGRLEFWVDDASVPRTMALYKSLRRDITVTELNLTPDKRKEVAEFLAWNIEPENRDYLYHHYLDNCATRVRDVIDKAVDGQLEVAASDPSRFTFREHTHRHTQRNAYIDVLLSLWMNDDIDEPLREWDDMFLPSELLTQVRSLEYTNPDGEVVPLVVPEREKLIYDAKREPLEPEPYVLWPWTMLFGVLFGGSALWFARRYETTGKTSWRLSLGAQHFLAGILFGVPGLVAALFHLSDHTVTYYNENLFLWSPLTFLALPLSFPIMRGRVGAMRVMRICWYVMAVTSLLGLALKLLPWFDQANGMGLAMLVPFNLLMAAAMHRFGPPVERGQLEEIDDGLWVVSSSRRFLDLKLGARTTIVRLPGGGLWVHSPLALDEELAESVAALGPVEHLVAPNKFHHMHLGEWKARFPDAKSWAAPGLAAKRSDLDFAGTLGDEPPAEWGGALEQHHFRGAPMVEEVVFFHPSTKTLIVADTAMNFGTSDHLPTRLFLKLTKRENAFGFTATERAMFRDHAAARESLARVLEWDFERIVLAHGAIANGDDLAAKYAGQFDFLK